VNIWYEHVMVMMSKEYSSYTEDFSTRSNRSYFQQWQDGPEGHSILVIATKGERNTLPTHRSICRKCTYVKRGSFKGAKLSTFVRMLHKNPALKGKFLGYFLRRVLASLLFFEMCTVKKYSMLQLHVTVTWIWKWSSIPKLNLKSKSNR